MEDVAGFVAWLRLPPEGRDGKVAVLHPYWYKHINVTGHYSFQASGAGGADRRPLRDPDLPDDE